MPSDRVDDSIPGRAHITIFPLSPPTVLSAERNLVSVENLVDEMIERARLHAVEVPIVSYHRELLTEYEGIAAVVYAPVTAT